MGLQSDLTYLHMNAGTAIDQVQRGLYQWSREPADPDRAERFTNSLVNATLRLRRDLEAFFERERRELLPRVRRIFGSDVTEVQKLVGHQGMVLTALDRFIVTFTDDLPDDPTDRQVHLAHLKELFAEFIERYEARCDADRAFYQTYSTVLYPGGLATE